MKPVLSLFAIIAALVLMWACAAVKITQPAKADIPAPITQTIIDQIHYGMTLEEVTAIVGCKGTESSNTSPKSGSKLTISRWTHADTSLWCTFKDNRLVEIIANPGD